MITSSTPKLYSNYTKRLIPEVRYIHITLEGVTYLGPVAQLGRAPERREILLGVAFNPAVLGSNPGGLAILRIA